MTDIIVEIMVAVLSFLALATKEMGRGRIGKSADPRFTAFDSSLVSEICQEADGQ
jgi:hypothetical protein